MKKNKKAKLFDELSYSPSLSASPSLAPEDDCCGYEGIHWPYILDLRLNILGVDVLVIKIGGKEYEFKR